jgi:hypothetical protein
MATLIPPYTSCTCRMTSGERRFAQRLESLLEPGCLLARRTRRNEVPTPRLRAAPLLISKRLLETSILNAGVIGLTKLGRRIVGMPIQLAA